MELKPDWGKGYSRLGAAYYGLGEWEDAVRAYEDGGWLQGVGGGVEGGVAWSWEWEDAVRAYEDGGWLQGVGGGVVGWVCINGVPSVNRIRPSPQNQRRSLDTPSL